MGLVESIPSTAKCDGFLFIGVVTYSFSQGSLPGRARTLILLLECWGVNHLTKPILIGDCAYKQESVTFGR